MNIDDIDLTALASLTGISEVCLSQILDPSKLQQALETATTVGDAWGVYDNTPSGSAVRVKALE
jgi:hypothetical protein